jgi:hypothetical protein
LARWKPGPHARNIWGSGTRYGVVVVFGVLGEGGWVDAVLKSEDTIRSRAWKSPFTTCLKADASMARGKLHFIHNT